MYLGVDVGGTKTLVAVLDNNGVITEHDKFATSEKYNDFLQDLAKVLDSFKAKDFKAAGAGITAVTFDRKHGIGINFGNLPWKNVHIQHDLETLAGCPFVIENDAKMACLSEAMLLKDKYSKIAYITVSTGIGYALVENGKLNTSIGDGGGRTILLEHKGKMVAWEDFAGGRAIVERYGKQAHEITDKATWQAISRDLAKGLIQLIAIMQPDVVVVGGSVGTFFKRYEGSLKTELEKYELPLVRLPVLVQAQRPEEAVIFGCYDLAKQIYGHA